MSLSREPIVILGAFRSGTSCLAIALARLGIHLGDEKDFLPADQFNEGGYQELEEMQNLNARCLAAFGMNYFQAEPLPTDWMHFPGAAEMVHEIRELLKRHFSGRPAWGWKEPSTTILLPLFKTALMEEGVDHPRYPISIRHPMSVAASQIRRQSKFGFAAPELVFEESEAPPIEQRTIGLWLHYTLSALMETRGQFRQVFSYENFLFDPRPYLERLTSGMADCHPAEKDIAESAATVRPELSHSKFSREDLVGLPSIVARTYDCCLSAESNFDDLNAGKFDALIEELWEEWRYMSSMAKPIFLPYTDMFITWREGRTTVKWTASGCWQIVRGVVAAAGNSTIQIDPTPLPSQIWIKRAIWRVDGRERKAVLTQGINGILEDFGLLRLSAYGPCPLITQTPAGDGPFELELELLSNTSPPALVDTITRMRMRLESVVRNTQGQRR